MSCTLKIVDLQFTNLVQMSQPPRKYVSKFPQKRLQDLQTSSLQSRFCYIQGSEATGEPETLVGKIDKKQMGNKATRERPPKQLKAQKQKRAAEPVHHSLLTQKIDDSLVYRPRTKENRAIYQHILSKLYQLLEDQPQEIFYSIADQVLAVLKADSITDSDRKIEVESLIGEKVKSDFFIDLYALAKQITDYKIQTGADNDLEVKAAVVFEQGEEDDQEEDSDEDEEQEVMSEEQEPQQTYIKATKEEPVPTSKYVLDVNQIDSQWLFQQLNKFYESPQLARIEKEVMLILKSKSNMECQGKLAGLLGTNKLQLIKLLVKNRFKIQYGIKFAQATSDRDKEQLAQELRRIPDGQQILLQLSKSKSKKEDTRMKDESEQDTLTLTHMSSIKDEDIGKIAKKILDFDQLEPFSSKKEYTKLKLPEGSIRIEKNGYQEVRIPARKPRTDDKLVKIEELPAWMQNCFPGVKKFNPVQSAVLQCALYSRKNMLICAPTSSGKTNIAMLTILNTLAQYMNSDGEYDLSKFKIIYIAPMKALVAEITGNLSNRLKGITVKELTGDMQLSRQQIEETQIIVCTPEKWDIITRKAGDRLFTELVRLVIIDEIHLLGDARGPVLQAIIARTIRQVETTQEQVRLVGLSATLPNYQDIATVLRVSPNDGLFYFDSSYRPIPLEQIYIGITQKKGVKKMLLLNEILYEKIMERVISSTQILVFVHSRRDTVRTAKALKEMAFAKDQLKNILKPDSQSKKVLESIVETQKINSSDLKELLVEGIGIHHAGLSRDDRELVEQLYANRHLTVLVSTATLAWGVNLPAHTVIIKGTQVYSPEQGKWIELSQQDIFQMMGRGGRPKYDDSGQGIIITGYEELRYYLGILNTQIPIESQFTRSLADQLNAEIVLGSVNSLKEGVTWLGYTYLYVRMLKNPTEYAITSEEIEEDPHLIKRRVNLIHSAATLLDRSGLIKYDRRTNTFSSTALGKIASYYYIKNESIAIYNDNLKPGISLIELFKIFSMSVEFKLVPVRDEEKSELTKMIDCVPVPIKGSADDPSSKISVLLQAYISRLPLEGYALNSDKVYITQSASRIMRSLFEICLRRGWGQATQISLQAAKMVDKCMWASMNPLRQFRQIPDYVLSRLQKKEQFSWEAFYQMTPQEIGQLIKFPKLGKIIHKFVHQVPRVELDAYAQPITRSCLRVDLTIKADFRWEDQIHGREEPFWLMVFDCDEEHILYSSQISLKKSHPELFVQFTVPLFQILHPLYYIKVISDRWLCPQSCLPLSFRTIILPSKFPQPLELADLQPMPVGSLGSFSGLARDLKINYLNQMQTQVFPTIVNSNGNVFIGTAAGSGKFTLAIFAIQKCLELGRKVVIMMPNQDSLNVQYELVHKLFGNRVSSMSGQATKDLVKLANFDIIMTTPESWDVISRRWKTRKGFEQIGLFITDMIQLLGEAGSAMEVMVSRMRYITSQIQTPIRIIVLGSSIADYRDIAQWVGATHDHTFNFQPNTRQQPIQMIIQGFDQSLRESRLHSMQKQMFQNIKLYGRNTIVLVNDSRQAKLTALDLVTLVGGDSNPKRFVRIPEEQMKVFQKKISEKYLAYSLEYGIGFVYEGMPEKDRQIVEELFKIDGISILICTFQLRWQMTSKAFMVVVLDPARYDGKDNRWVDYSIPDMLQIMSWATTSEKDRKKSKQHFAAKFYILCVSSKKEFYKKFLFEPYPVESSLNLYLANHMNAQIVAKKLQKKDDCVDWITWTFLYRRLTQNPNYYNLQQVTELGINDYLSELIENTVQYLQNIKCVEVEEEIDLNATNLGIVCSYYYISTSTMATFVEKLTDNLKLKNLIEIISEAYEFQDITYRQNESSQLAQMCLPLQITPINKAHALLVLHFSRIALPPDLLDDCKKILVIGVRLLHALVDIISSFGYLKPLILTMQLCQMLVQAMWINDSPLLQIVERPCAENLINSFNVKDVNDFSNMEDADRLEAIKGYDVDKIAEACNRYPVVSMTVDSVEFEEEVTINVSLERDAELSNEYVKCPYFPKDDQEESWWIVVGDKKSNKVLTIVKTTFKLASQKTLRFEPIPEVKNYTIYALCDSYVGCDQAEQISSE